MAESGNGSNTGFFGIFKKQAPRSQKVVEQHRETVLDCPSAIAPLFVSALEEALLVRILMNNGSFSCSSYLAWELEDDSVTGGVLDSKTYLEEGRYLLLVALYPPIANLKIRSASRIVLEFASQFNRLECDTTLEQITHTRKIQLAFPTHLKQNLQRRLAYRALGERDMDISVLVLRPAGIVFRAKLLNVSASGAAFYGAGPEPKIAEHSKVQMTIGSPEHSFVVNAVVMGVYRWDGNFVFRVQFLVSGYEVSGEINALTNYMQRENIRRRSVLLK